MALPVLISPILGNPLAFPESRGLGGSGSGLLGGAEGHVAA